MSNNSNNSNNFNNFNQPTSLKAIDDYQVTDLITNKYLSSTWTTFKGYLDWCNKNNIELDDLVVEVYTLDLKPNKEYRLLDWLLSSISVYEEQRTMLDDPREIIAYDNILLGLYRIFR